MNYLSAAPMLKTTIASLLNVTIATYVQDRYDAQHLEYRRYQAFNLIPWISSCASLSKKLHKHRTLAFIQSPTGRSQTHLYHQIVGPTVPRCQRLWASTQPPIGGKSNNSKLIARTIHATIKPGEAAQVLLSLRYLPILNALQRTFCTIPTTTLAAMLYV